MDKETTQNKPTMADKPITNAPNNDYNPYNTFVKEVRYEKGDQKEYKPMRIPENERHNASFKLPFDMEATIQGLLMLFLPDSILHTIKVNSNNYIRAKERRIPAISTPELMVFFSIIFYMGVVKLPAKKDYWETDGMWPTHKPCQRMSSRRFHEIWNNIHLSKVEEREEEPEGENGGDFFDDRSEGSIETTIEPVDNRWYAKAALLIDQFNKVSQQVCQWPSFALSIDEQMKKFKGRSKQTFRMKHKPIKEGYKFWALCCSQTGYCYKVLPAARVGDTNEEGKQVIESVLTLAKALPKNSKKFVIGMDNFFTFPRTLTGLRELGIAVVGTARGRRGWPPKEIKRISDDRFNTLYWINDERNFQIQRWVDNNTVTMVSTMHTAEETVLKLRRKPRTTTTNKKHVEDVWGGEYKQAINIPTAINDYNHWMLGVDKCDQLISYYRHELRCRRIWMPIMFHALDLMRVNMFIAYNEMMKEGEKLDHKKFVLGLVEKLLERAMAKSFMKTRSTHEIVDTIAPPKKKRKRLNAKTLSLPKERLYGSSDVHVVTISDKKSSCKYCSFLQLKHKAQNIDSEPPKVSIVYRMCAKCNVHLCAYHFPMYHMKIDEDDVSSLSGDE